MKHEVDLLDDEYMTPQQAAELRRTMTELPLWQQVAPNVDVAPHAIDCFSTEGTAQVQTVDAPADVSSAYNPDYGKWADAVALHRAINDTTGMESEE